MSMILILYIIFLIHILITWLWAYRKGKNARLQMQEYRLLDPDRYPFISIIIPAWNDYPVLQRCLISLAGVDYPDSEIIIVAGGTNNDYERTKILCQKYKNIQVIEQGPNGKNAALNQGFSISQGQFIVLLDADTTFQPDFLFQLITPLVTVNADASTGKITPFVKSPVSQCLAMDTISAQEIKKLISLQGACIALKREVVDEIGGFPEEIKVGCDWDLTHTLVNKKKVFCPNALVATDLPVSFTDFLLNEVRWRRAHFASIFRFRLSPFSMAVSIYIYLLAWFYGIFTLISAFLILVPNIDRYIFAGWLIFTVWILLRRVSLAIEVFAYTGDKANLRIAWVPPVLLLETFMAIIVATLSPGKINPHFKGVRS